ATRPFHTLVLSLEIRSRLLEFRNYAPAAFKSSLACFSAFFVSLFASASGFIAWIALLRVIALSPAGPLHEDISALVWTPVTFDFRQLKSTPTFLLACSAATESSSALKFSQALLASVLAGRTPWACKLAVNFLSCSSLASSVSLADFGSFFTHLMGFSECVPLELLEDADPAPAPCGPCAAALAAPKDTLIIATATTRTSFFICPPITLSGRIGETRTGPIHQ